MQQKVLLETAKTLFCAFLSCHPCLGQELGPLAITMLKAKEEGQGMESS